MTVVEIPIQRSESAASIAAALQRHVSAASLIRQNEPMARRTTMRVGGSADVWLEPASEEDLAAALAFTAGSGTPVMVIGRGSNLLVRDGGIRGVVICLSQPHFARIDIEQTRIRCGAGVRLKTVAVEARKQALTGFEFLEGIPGSVGGALRMNAGAHGGAMFDRVVEVRMLDMEGKACVLPREQLAAVYRACPTLRTHIAVEVVLQGQPGDSAAIDGRMKTFNQARWSSQPAAPSAGCMFKNPAAAPAGKLVDDLGLKGTRVGGAAVSLEHGNFIVTDGSATAADVLALIRLIQAEVQRHRGIELETEVQVIGEEMDQR